MSSHLRILSAVFAVAVGAVFSLPALAWGPTTRKSVVMTAMHVLDKEGVVQISRLSREVQEGAMASSETIQRIHPAYSVGPLRAIEAEIRLLSSVRGSSVDPYYAYRLGMLGALISQVSAPLAEEPSAYRTQYYQDVDNSLQRVALKTSVRKTVDVVPYLEHARTLANVRRDLLLKDYQAGIGFSGVARSSLAEDTSRSVDAVADIWYTLLTGPGVQAAVSNEQAQNYIVDALQFYVRRGNVKEVDANYARLIKLAPKTSALARKIGDIFYTGRMYERAIREYELVLQHEPGQRDILDKMAAYYVQVGDGLAMEKRLEEAYEAYARAAKVDPLNSTGELKRLQMQKQIDERNSRQEEARQLIAQAAELQTRAEELSFQQRNADAITALREAESKYGLVTSEFPTEAQAAAAGLTAIKVRLKDLTTNLIQNAQTLSGSGSLVDVQRLAEKSSGEIDQAALKALNAQRLSVEIDRLKDEMKPALEFR